MVAAAPLILATGAVAASSDDYCPGVTANSITDGDVGIELLSLIQGEKVYFNYINAQGGGVNGRKIDHKYQLDDGVNPTTFNQPANTVINQDHVFAVTGVPTAFSPDLFTESGTPTCSYNVTGN